MTPQEQEMIDGLISRIRSTQVDDKDTAAEQRLQQGLAGYPDAVYVLAQTVLVQQYGLEQAKAQLQALKQQNDALQQQGQSGAGQPRSSGGGSFLSHIFGGSSEHTQPPPQPQTPAYQPVNNPGYGAAPAGGYPPPPAAYPPQAYPAAPSGGMFGGGGGFLSGALQTAAGVAAGEVAFQGMESLFHGFEHGGGGGYGFGGGYPGGGGGGETIVNNYYDDNGGDRDRGDAGRDDSSFYNPSDDASRDGGANFADTGSGNDDGGNFDDNSGNDDSASFDDSNDFGGDSGGGF